MTWYFVWTWPNELVRIIINILNSFLELLLVWMQPSVLFTLQNIPTTKSVPRRGTLVRVKSKLTPLGKLIYTWLVCSWAMYIAISSMKMFFLTMVTKFFVLLFWNSKCVVQFCSSKRLWLFRHKTDYRVWIDIVICARSWHIRIIKWFASISKTHEVTTSFWLFI